MKYLPMEIYIAIWCKMLLVKFYGPDLVLSSMSKSKVISPLFHTLDLHQYKTAESESAYFNYILLKFSLFFNISVWFFYALSLILCLLCSLAVQIKSILQKCKLNAGDMELTPGVCPTQYRTLLIPFKKDVKWSWLLYFWLKSHL